MIFFWIVVTIIVALFGAFLRWITADGTDLPPFDHH
jgi:hypothetical protein